MKEFSKYKFNFFNFTRPLLKYMKLIVNQNTSNYDDNDNNNENYTDNNLKYILIVDDEKLNTKSLKKLLKNYLLKINNQRIKIITLNDGIEALNLIYYDTLFFMKISIVICDLNMNFMNGDLLSKVLEQINKNVFQRIRFVMYTNTDYNTVVYNNSWIKYFLKKPCSRIDIEKLFNDLDEI